MPLKTPEVSAIDHGVSPQQGNKRLSNPLSNFVLGACSPLALDDDVVEFEIDEANRIRKHVAKSNVGGQLKTPAWMQQRPKIDYENNSPLVSPGPRRGPPDEIFCSEERRGVSNDRYAGAPAVVMNHDHVSSSDSAFQAEQGDHSSSLRSGLDPLPRRKSQEVEAEHVPDTAGPAPTLNGGVTAGPAQRNKQDLFGKSRTGGATVGAVPMATGPGGPRTRGRCNSAQTKNRSFSKGQHDRSMSADRSFSQGRGVVPGSLCIPGLHQHPGGGKGKFARSISPNKGGKGKPPSRGPSPLPAARPASPRAAYRISERQAQAAELLSRGYSPSRGVSPMRSRPPSIEQQMGGQNAAMTSKPGAFGGRNPSPGRAGAWSPSHRLASSRAAPGGATVTANGAPAYPRPMSPRLLQRPASPRLQRPVSPRGGTKLFAGGPPSSGGQQNPLRTAGGGGPPQQLLSGGSQPSSHQPAAKKPSYLVRGPSPRKPARPITREIHSRIDTGLRRQRPPAHKDKPSSPRPAGGAGLGAGLDGDIPLRGDDGVAEHDPASSGGVVPGGTSALGSGAPSGGGSFHPPARTIAAAPVGTSSMPRGNGGGPASSSARGNARGPPSVRALSNGRQQGMTTPQGQKPQMPLQRPPSPRLYGASSMGTVPGGPLMRGKSPGAGSSGAATRAGLIRNRSGSRDRDMRQAPKATNPVQLNNKRDRDLRGAPERPRGATNRFAGGRGGRVAAAGGFGVGGGFGGGGGGGGAGPPANHAGSRGPTSFRQWEREAVVSQKKEFIDRPLSRQKNRDALKTNNLEDGGELPAAGLSSNRIHHDRMRNRVESGHSNGSTSRSETPHRRGTPPPFATDLLANSAGVSDHDHVVSARMNNAGPEQSASPPAPPELAARPSPANPLSNPRVVGTAPSSGGAVFGSSENSGSREQRPSRGPALPIPPPSAIALSGSSPPQFASVPPAFTADAGAAPGLHGGGAEARAPLKSGSISHSSNLQRPPSSEHQQQARTSDPLKPMFISYSHVPAPGAPRRRRSSDYVGDENLPPAGIQSGGGRRSFDHVEHIIYLNMLSRRSWERKKSPTSCGGGGVLQRVAFPQYRYSHIIFTPHRTTWAAAIGCHSFGAESKCTSRGPPVCGGIGGLRRESEDVVRGGRPQTSAPSLGGGRAHKALLDS